jgi:hypothetical protein
MNIKVYVSKLAGVHVSLKQWSLSGWEKKRHLNFFNVSPNSNGVWGTADLPQSQKQPEHSLIREKPAQLSVWDFMKLRHS